MSLIKGFDRIFLIISILGIIPILYLTPDFVERKLTVEAVEYREYINKIRNDIENASADEVQKWKHDYCRKQLEAMQSGNSPGDPSCSDNPRELYGYHKNKEVISKAPARFKKPPPTQVIGISFIVAVIGGSILFFILKSTTRLIKWIVEGFRAD